MEALATHACGAANGKYDLLQDGWDVTLAVRINAPVSDRQTEASGAIYRVASTVANRLLATVARKVR